MRSCQRVTLSLGSRQTLGLCAIKIQPPTLSRTVTLYDTSSTQQMEQSKITATSSARSNGILGLALELLESITEWCDPVTDFLALRLSCRTLAAGVFRSFTDHYISHLYCFMLDPKGLQRVINILEQPHLLARIRVVELTLVAHESEEARRPLALNRDDYHNTEPMLGSTYAQEEYDRLECPTHGISADCWSRIRLIMSQVGRTARTLIAFRTYSEAVVHSQIAVRQPKLPSRLLDLCLETGCKVKTLILSNAFEADVALFMPTQKYHPILQDIQKFAYVCRSFQPNDLDNTKTSRQCDLVKVITEGSPNLRDLRLVVHPHFSPVTQDCKSVSTRLLSDSTLPCLRLVALVHLQCRQADLLGFLHRCPDSLETFWVEQVAIYHPPGDPITPILNALT